ncbi:GntR family transcriptional regulator [Bradyrhizobium sp. 40]|uniref:GntR family transcriptional regulator n=1 Tax=Bradyrhizobium sp. 40 TaxID=2782674 RepID=UPI001FFFF19F|nr:GntR family transcriptional regulator [Bradyrhizobium sp. 40]UPJ44122.1 GntR family transcriptional regulator [Bradyrhizobium sp. 40]
MRKPVNNLPPRELGSAFSQAEAAHPTASAFATERVREAILNGDIQPGQRLQQHSLAARLGLSHVPLREAFFRLQSEGFITINPRRGAFVAQLTKADAEEIFELRANLEVAALRASIPKLSPEQLIVANDICVSADAIHDYAKYGEVNWQFHRALYIACQRPRTLCLIDTLWRNASRYSMLLRHRDPYLQKSQQEHWDILEAVSRRSSEQACKLLKAHVVVASKRIVALLKS